MGSFTFAFILAEVVLRVFFAQRFPKKDDELSLLYNYHPTLGWFPATNTTHRFTGTRTITVTHSSKGFRAAEPEQAGQTKPGIVVLGDSFVWGFDVEAAERFTDKLQVRHPEWNIFNLGVSGYSTDQEYLLLNTCFDDYRPRAVILVFCSDNDFNDNGRNWVQSGAYKPYFLRTGTNQITLQGVPVPKSEQVILAEHRMLSRSYIYRLILRQYCQRHSPPLLEARENPSHMIMLAMQSYVVQRGGLFGVAVEEGSENAGLKVFLNQFKIPWVSLNTTNRYPTFGGHWTPEGHDEVTQTLDQFLKQLLGPVQK